MVGGRVVVGYLGAGRARTRQTGLGVGQLDMNDRQRHCGATAGTGGGGRRESARTQRHGRGGQEARCSGRRCGVAKGQKAAGCSAKRRNKDKGRGRTLLHGRGTGGCEMHCDANGGEQISKPTRRFYEYNYCVPNHKGGLFPCCIHECIATQQTARTSALRSSPTSQMSLTSY